MIEALRCAELILTAPAFNSSQVYAIKKLLQINFILISYVLNRFRI